MAQTKMKGGMSSKLLTSKGNLDDDGKRILRGRPKHLVTEATKHQVLQLCAFGMTHDQIATVLGINRNTLAKYYRHELDTGLLQMNASVAQNLYRIATGEEKEAVRAAIFWLMQRGGDAWRHTQKVESSVDVKVKAERTIDSRQLSMEDRQALRAILMRATESADQGNVIEHQTVDEEEE